MVCYPSPRDFPSRMIFPVMLFVVVLHDENIATTVLSALSVRMRSISYISFTIDSFVRCVVRVIRNIAHNHISNASIWFSAHLLLLSLRILRSNWKYSEVYQSRFICFANILPRNYRQFHSTISSR